MLRRLVYAMLFVFLTFGIYKQQGMINELQNRIEYRSDQQLSSLISRVVPSVVCVEAIEKDYEFGTNRSGSGVIVGSHVVLTAGHMIEDADELKIITADGKQYTTKMWVQHPDIDCRLVFFDEELGPVAKFADFDKIKVGDKVIVVGSPYGKDFFNTVTAGIVSGLNREISFFGETPVLTVDAASNPGNSGGPVFDMQGRIIGIIVGGIRGADDLSVLIPVNECKKFLE